MAFGDVTKAEAKATFKSFMNCMQERLQDFIDIGACFGYVFDYRISECRQIELFFDDFIEHYYEDELEDVLTFFSRYLGEIVIREYGGKWILYQGSKRDIDHFCPVVTGLLGIENIPFNTEHTMHAYYLRHQEGMIERMITAHINALKESRRMGII